MDATCERMIMTLSKTDGYVTAIDIAAKLGVSEKTVYRKVRLINDSLGIDVIHSERGRGYRINYDQYLAATNKKTHNDIVDYSPVERRNKVLLSILFSAPFSISVDKLYGHYYVSNDLIQQDLSILSKLLKNYAVRLSRKGNKISVVGDEEAIRRSINMALVQSNLMSVDSPQGFASEVADINVYDNQFLTAQIEWIQRSLDLTIPYPYNVNIFSHLYILIKRFRTGKVIEDDKAKKAFANEAKTIENNPEFFAVASDVIKNTSDYLHTSLPEIEKGYLLQYLISMRYDHDVTFNGMVSDEVMRLVNLYIQGFNLTESDPRVQSLKQDLIGHVKPMLNRLENYIIVANRLLNDIKLEYGSLFETVKGISERASQIMTNKAAISDDESGFITLYFAKYFEESRPVKKALIMCASGVGTSKLLHAKVHQAFPNLRIVGTLSIESYQDNEENYQDVDLIITTVNIHPINQTRVVLSSAMFTQADRKSVESALYGS